MFVFDDLVETEEAVVKERYKIVPNDVASMTTYRLYDTVVGDYLSAHYLSWDAARRAQRKLENNPW